MITYDKGRYKIKVQAQGFSESKEKKTPFFFLEGKVVAAMDPATGDWSETELQYTRTLSLWLTDKTAEQTAERLQSLGWNGKWSDLDPSNRNFHDFNGTEVVVDCKHDKYDGGESEKWEWPYDGGNMFENDPSITKKVEAMFGRNLKRPASKTTNAPPNGDPMMPTQEELQEAAATNELPF